MVAEIVAGIAIIVTLAFLAYEMRSNTDAIRAQTYTDLMTQINDWRKLTVTDESLSALIDKRQSHGWEGLSSDEERRMWYREIVLSGVYESAFYAKQRGILGDDEWMRFETVMCNRYGIGENWDPPGDRAMTDVLTPRFAEFVIQSCK